MKFRVPRLLQPLSWIDIGIDHHLKEFDKRRIRVLNIANFAIICYSGSFSLVELFFYEDLSMNYLIADSLNLPVTALSLYLTYRRLYNLGKLVSMVGNMSLVVMLKLFFNDSGLELVGVIGIIAAVFLLEEVPFTVAMLLFSMVSYLLLVTGFNFSGDELLSLSLLKQFFLLVLIFLVLQSINSQIVKYHRVLWQQRRMLIKKNQELDELNSFKTRLFTIVSHDLRGPMGALELCFNEMKDDTLTQRELEAMFPEMVKSVESVNILLKNLLEWSQSQLADQGIKSEEIKIEELIDRLCSLFELQASHKNIRLQSHINEKKVIALGDRNFVETILRNLMSNAIKFSSPGKVVMIEAHAENGQVTISVIDQGVGMSPEQIKNILSLKGKKTLGTLKEEGSGLGLLLTQQLLHKSGRQLDIISKPNAGTTITFQLPVAATTNKTA
jgi:two-component system, sensor histidine kinase and response regulator